MLLEITVLHSLAPDAATSLNRAKLIIYISSLIKNQGKMIHEGSCNVTSKNSSLFLFYKTVIMKPFCVRSSTSHTEGNLIV